MQKNIKRTTSKTIEQGIVRISVTYEIPISELVTDILPQSCGSCPVGFQSIPDCSCGRNVPYQAEDWKQRPATCKLRTLEEYLREVGQ